MPSFLPTSARPSTRVMMFVDGENLTMRYGALLNDEAPGSHVVFEREVFVWSRYASRPNAPEEFIRRYYYTSCRGDESKRTEIADRLRELGLEAPRVFPRPKSGRSKRVDITLATDMLIHAHRKNFDIAILVAGDQDYVPLVEAVKAEGRRLSLWFVDSGLSPALRAAADHYWNLGELLFADPRSEPAFHALYG